MDKLTKCEAAMDSVMCVEVLTSTLAKDVRVQVVYCVCLFHPLEKKKGQ